MLYYHNCTLLNLFEYVSILLVNALPTYGQRTLSCVCFQVQCLMFALLVSGGSGAFRNIPMRLMRLHPATSSFEHRLQNQVFSPLHFNSPPFVPLPSRRLFSLTSTSLKSTSLQDKQYERRPLTLLSTAHFALRPIATQFVPARSNPPR